MKLTTPCKSVTIVTICRNSVKTIGKTIESVLTQSFTGLEYIVVDGASSDGTQGIVESFGNSVDIFISEADQGISDAFNKGVRLASGEVIGLINSDDILLPDALHNVCSFFQNNPDVDVLHGDIMLYDDNVFVKRIKPPVHWWYPWRLVLFNHPATFVKKSVYDKYGLFSPEYKFAMDDDLFLKWIRSGVKIEYFPEPLVRMQAGGLSGKFAFQVFSEKRKALIRWGFSPLLANIQYMSRFGVQLIALFQSRLRSIYKS